MEIVPRSVLGELLFGHLLPTPPLPDARTVTVTHLITARKLVKANAIAPDGFHVSAEDACGVPLACTQG
ncbi:hypothetical protein ACWEPL_05865 [Nonomuraea sp. NPDC004186]